jgi:hypothetical protein
MLKHGKKWVWYIWPLPTRLLVKYLYTILFVALRMATGHAQTALPLPSGPVSDSLPPRYWTTSLKAGLNVNEAFLSDNWKGGGTSMVGLSTLFNGKANYHRARHTWGSEADFLFAFQYAKGQGYRKTLDRLWLDTKYGCDLTQHWGLFTSLNLLTQFAPGYSYDTDSQGGARARQVSGFFAPAYLTSAYGVEYHPSTRFRLRLSPFSPRLTVVRDIERFQGSPTDIIYGVNPGHSTRWEVLAAQALAELDQPLGPNANLKARYVLFANYESFTLQKIDHRLDLTLTAKVNKYISVSFGGIVLYDYDQDAGIQYNQNLALGILLSRERAATAP